MVASGWGGKAATVTTDKAAGEWQGLHQPSLALPPLTAMSSRAEGPDPVAGRVPSHTPCWQPAPVVQQAGQSSCAAIHLTALNGKELTHHLAMPDR